jgi:ferredoxin
MTPAARLRVNPIACDARGLCAEVLPELIILDDWGFPLIRDEDVPPGLRREAAEAVRLCPKLALRLVSQARATARPRRASAQTPAPARWLVHLDHSCPDAATDLNR